MKGFKDLPDSLVQSVIEVMEKANVLCDGCGVAKESCGCEAPAPEEKIEENVAISPAELASPEPNSAIGMREPGTFRPKHVDIVHETDMRPLSAEGTKKEGFRALLQYPTGRLEFVPNLEFEAAPSPQALLALITDETGEIQKAVEAALNLPHNQAQFKGNQSVDGVKAADTVHQAKEDELNKEKFDQHTLDRKQEEYE